LLHSKNESWGSYNYTGFINTELDKIIEEAANTFDEQKRIELYKKAMQIAYNDAVFIPLYYPNVLMLAQKWLKLKVRSDERIYAFEITK
jgi:ABC-type transport system substrate-binding protein